MASSSSGPTPGTTGEHWTHLLELYTNQSALNSLATPSSSDGPTQLLPSPQASVGFDPSSSSASSAPELPLRDLGDLTSRPATPSETPLLYQQLYTTYVEPDPEVEPVSDEIAQLAGDSEAPNVSVFMVGDSPVYTWRAAHNQVGLIAPVALMAQLGLPVTVTSSPLPSVPPPSTPPPSMPPPSTPPPSSPPHIAEQPTQLSPRSPRSRENSLGKGSMAILASFHHKGGLFRPTVDAMLYPDGIPLEIAGSTTTALPEDALEYAGNKNSAIGILDEVFFTDNLDVPSLLRLCVSVADTRTALSSHTTEVRNHLDLKAMMVVVLLQDDDLAQALQTFIRTIHDAFSTPGTKYYDRYRRLSPEAKRKIIFLEFERIISSQVLGQAAVEVTARQRGRKIGYVGRALIEVLGSRCIVPSIVNILESDEDGLLAAVRDTFELQLFEHWSGLVPVGKTAFLRIDNPHVDQPTLAEALWALSQCKNVPVVLLPEPERVEQYDIPPATDPYNRANIGIHTPVEGGVFVSSTYLFMHPFTGAFFQQSMKSLAVDFPDIYKKLVEDQEKANPEKDMIPHLYSESLTNATLALTLVGLRKTRNITGRDLVEGADAEIEYPRIARTCRDHLIMFSRLPAFRSRFLPWRSEHVRYMRVILNSHAPDTASVRVRQVMRAFLPIPMPPCLGGEDSDSEEQPASKRRRLSVPHFSNLFSLDSVLYKEAEASITTALALT